VLGGMVSTSYATIPFKLTHLLFFTATKTFS